MKTCGNCKWHDEFDSRHVRCYHPKESRHFVLRYSVCDRWKPLTYFDAMIELKEAVAELKAVVLSEIERRVSR